jgi:TRAP-type C4-dicarboxylate transport system permease large subunit
MGYSGIWFGVMTIMMKISGFITPPVGLITLLGSAMAGVPSSQVFKAQWPFYVTVILACIILIFFPQIATVLPDLMFG